MKGSCRACDRNSELLYCDKCYRDLFAERIDSIFEGSKVERIELEVRILRRAINKLMEVIKYKVDVSPNAIRAIEDLRNETKGEKEDIFK